MFVEIAHRIYQIFTDWYGTNEAAEPVPPVLPRHISKIYMHKFVKVVQSHRQRIIYLFDNEDVDLLIQ